MTSHHRQPQRSWRPDPDEYDKAKAQLGARGRSVSAYLRACLRWLNRDPDGALDALEADWPPPRPTGRPPLDRRSDGGEHPTKSLGES
jgi:hypothetical protein